MSASLDPARSFQGLILTLQTFWAEHGCVILQPYDVEMGAGTDTPPFELQTRGGVVQAIRCTPAALRLLAPLAGAVVEPLELPPGTHLAFATSALRPAALTQPVQVHVADLPAPTVALFLANPVIAVLRPDDLLSLRFGFAGLTLAASSDGTPELRVEIG